MTPSVAHQFDDARQQHEAATLGMWVFLVTEVMFFGGMFTGYTLYRHNDFAAFEAGSRQLDLLLGAVNTGVLLTSSLAMAFAVHATAAGRRKAAIGWLLTTVLLGTAFLGIKGYEYWHKFETGLVPGDAFQSPIPQAGINPGHVEMFFVFYFVMTGIHALHMLIGLGVLAVLLVMVSRDEHVERVATSVEMTGLYWHFVDAIWVFLFPLLYLIES